MSCDAKVWKDGTEWHGIHDGDCEMTPEVHVHVELENVLETVRSCYGHPLYWEFRVYPEGKGVGLVAYGYPRD
jgi:hypothetical protein